nr:hypothetical protein Itr_chr06CG19510 [Ipomoea trifida]
MKRVGHASRACSSDPGFEAAGWTGPAGWSPSRGSSSFKRAGGDVAVGVVHGAPISRQGARLGTGMP